MPKQRASTVEGRATSARPSLRSLLAIAAFAVPALAGPAAQAAPPEPPVLTHTAPASKEDQPASSTTPRVFGSDEVIEQRVPFSGAGIAGSSLGAAAFDPSFEVEIYANENCEGDVLADLTAGQLKSQGVEIEVEPDDVTIFYAKQVDPDFPGEFSECSVKGLPYWHSSTAVPPKEDPPGDPDDPGGPSSNDPPSGGVSAPPPSPRLRTVPGGRANDNTPVVTGSAPDAATVKVFAGPGCKGEPVAKGSAEQFFFAGFEVRVIDNDESSFSGVSVAGGGESACSEPVTYVEDSIAPQTRITMGPGAKTRKRSAIFRFTDATDNAPGTAYYCKVDRRKWKPCGSPLRLKKLSLKRHTLRVKATDPAGNAETRGAKRSFKVVRRP